MFFINHSTEPDLRLENRTDIDIRNLIYLDIKKIKI